MDNENYGSSEISSLYSPGKSYWNNRKSVLEHRQKFAAMSQAVASPVNLSLHQWNQLFTFALEFKPDLIVELGRGPGNSTCVFTEVANALKPGQCKVLSLCLTDEWQKKTVPELRKVVEESWFEPLEAIQGDIVKFNFKDVLSHYNRIFLFYDAHGYDVAEHILGTFLPAITDRPHLVVVHDLSDARYVSLPQGDYRLWKGENDFGARIRLGHIDSQVEEVISIIDFTQRNHLILHSADYSMHEELGTNQVRELDQTLGTDLFSQSCHWFWFSLNEIPKPYSFPIPGDISTKSGKSKNSFRAFMGGAMRRIMGSP